MDFRFDKLTVKAQEAVAAAQTLAAETGTPEVDSLHLLAALVGQSDGIVKPILDKIGVDDGQFSSLLQTELSRLPKVTGGSSPQPNQALIQVLQRAMREAETMKDDFVSTEHLLLAIVKTPCKAQDLLQVNGVRENDVLTALQSIRQSRSSDVAVMGTFLFACRHCQNGFCRCWCSRLPKFS